MLSQEKQMSKYKVVIKLDFNKRPSKKTILNSLFDMLRDNKVNYELCKQALVDDNIQIMRVQ